MKFSNRYDALMEKHRRIEAKIAAEIGRPLPDPFVLQRLKKQKLRIKDAIQSRHRRLQGVGFASQYALT
tara:strand:+ start:3984 stop:4190 length:207 start_codon:yes stop_codon:yes gene_type:complete